MAEHVQAPPSTEVPTAEDAQLLMESDQQDSLVLDGSSLSIAAEGDEEEGEATEGEMEGEQGRTNRCRRRRGRW